ncbi:MAG: hypothetical protein II161_00960, partial [Erysipelotrichaceae bacterium]|nr:hypothetical protein [Erysipelotrichaceae bacterium]
GARALMASCVYPVSEGMEVWTNTKKVLDSRKETLRLILSNHEKKCLSCIRSENCELQKLSKDLGIEDDNYFEGERIHYDLDKTSVHLIRDNNKCILLVEVMLELPICPPRFPLWLPGLTRVLSGVVAVLLLLDAQPAREIVSAAARARIRCLFVFFMFVTSLSCKQLVFCLQPYLSGEICFFDEQTMNRNLRFT